MHINQIATYQFWNLPQKGKEEADREKKFIDDIIQKAHIEKLILSEIGEIKTVFDGGAGTGRFSLMLAQLGKKVTHFDISESMIEVARKKAEELKVHKNIEFIRDDLNNLQKYSDNHYDLVLSIDAPVSYCYPNHKTVIKSLIELAKKRIILSVSSKFGSLNYAINPYHKYQYILDDVEPNELHQKLKSIDEKNLWKSLEAIEDILDSSKIGKEKEIEHSIANNNNPWPISYVFTAEELEFVLRENGIDDISFSGPGAFSRSIPNELLRKLISDPVLKERFLRICYNIDSQQTVAGMGKDNLTVVGNRCRNQRKI